jgi:predicted aconitase with swiveling domain
MSLVHIKSPELSTEQKKRIGDRIISAFHGEGFSSGSVVVLFEREVADMLLDGGLLFEARAPAALTVPAPAPVLTIQALAPLPVVAKASEDFKNKARRTKAELVELKAQLVTRLQAKGALSSFQAQLDLGLKACDWAPATLRRFFSELEEEGVIAKQGQKRGTRYVWKGISAQQVAVGAGPRLVKAVEEIAE